MSLKEINIEPDRALPCVDLVGARFITVPITLPGRPEGRLLVGTTKDHVLVVQAPEKVRVAYDSRHVLLVAAVAAKRQLDLEPRTLAGVIFLDDKFEGLIEVGGAGPAAKPERN